MSEKTEIKVPKKGGLKKAQQRLKDLLRKEPSSELVKIIEEVTRNTTEKKPSNVPDGIAAKEPFKEFEI